MNTAVNNAVIFTAGILIGGGAGYFVTKKLMEEAMERDLQEQIQDVKNHYKLLRKEDEFATPETVPTTTYEEIVESYNSAVNTVEDVVEIVSEAVEEISEILEAEVVEERNPEEPYIISVEEFMQDRENFDKNTITYFEDDDVLCDEREAVIPDVEFTIGSEALTKFGHKSNDENIVYVRNEKLNADFEVLREQRSYSEVVLGFKEEKEVLRMREDD